MRRLLNLFGRRMHLGPWSRDVFPVRIGYLGTEAWILPADEMETFLRLVEHVSVAPPTPMPRAPAYDREGEHQQAMHERLVRLTLHLADRAGPAWTALANAGSRLT